ncbi:hypothetical protein [Arenibaculum pallidiluteum]|uniref:hypothetical protein n=1 Tax=Arenibaculum pallidiluteum TaxID=2812559 RepID=UPI001A977B49|nr:hypothetical protein [Arenibaculum pallidiluteum]
MSGVLLPRSGRILFAAAAPPVPARPTARLLPVLALLGALPLFGQVFHYMIDLPPAYYLSKAWPFVTLPLALLALIRLRLPHKLTYVLMLAYCLGLTPILSMLHLGNGLFDAAATTVKVWPFTYYFALAQLLALLKPSAADVRRALAALGFATFAVMLALWLLVPSEHYAADPTQSKLLMFDVERGYRIFMPMVFGVMLLFYLARRFCDRRDPWALLLLLAGFAMMVLIYKQRMAIAAAAAVVGVIVVTSARGWWRVALLVVGGAAALGAVSVLGIDLAQKANHALGASLTIRQTSMALALDYLTASPMRWLFGIGSITRFSSVTLADIFGNAQFYLADIGWVGVLFEYGVIGTLLVMGVYGAALAVTRKGRRGSLSMGARRANSDPASAGPMEKALGDYVLFLVLSSLVYSSMFTPGEVATVMALAVHLRGLRGADPRSLRSRAHVSPSLPAPVRQERSSCSVVCESS